MFHLPYSLGPAVDNGPRLLCVAALAGLIVIGGGCAGSTSPAVLPTGEQAEVLDLGVAPGDAHDPLQALPTGVLEMSQLRVLRLHGNHLRDLPTELARLQKLDTIDLRRNRLDRIPEVLPALVNLRLLYLSGNPLPSDAVAGLRQTLPHTQIVFAGPDLAQPRPPQHFAPGHHDIIRDGQDDCAAGDDESCIQVGQIFREAEDLERAVGIFGLACARHRPLRSPVADLTKTLSARSWPGLACVEAGLAAEELVGSGDPRRRDIARAFFVPGCQEGYPAACGRLVASYPDLHGAKPEDHRPPREVWGRIIQALGVLPRIRGSADFTLPTGALPAPPVLAFGAGAWYGGPHQEQPHVPRLPQAVTLLGETSELARSGQAISEDHGGAPRTTCPPATFNGPGGCLPRSDHLRRTATEESLTGGCATGDDADCFVLAMRWRFRSPLEALDLAELSCRGGLGLACAFVARQHSLGWLGLRDPNRAEALTSRAYELLDRGCQRGIGLDCLAAADLYRANHLDQIQRKRKELNWLRDAVRHLGQRCGETDTDACLIAAQAQHELDGRPERWLQRACQDDPNACGLWIAALAQSPTGATKAKKKTREGCENIPCRALSLLTMTAEGGTKSDVRQGRRELKTLCDQGDTWACAHLDGLDAPTNPPGSTAPWDPFDLQARAECELGVAESCLAAGTNLGTGRPDKPIEETLGEAVRFLERACAGGLDIACIKMQTARRFLRAVRWQEADP